MKFVNFIVTSLHRITVDVSVSGLSVILSRITSAVHRFSIVYQCYRITDLFDCFPHSALFATHLPCSHVRKTFAHKTAIDV